MITLNRLLVCRRRLLLLHRSLLWLRRGRPKRPITRHHATIPLLLTALCLC